MSTLNKTLFLGAFLLVVFVGFGLNGSKTAFASTLTNWQNMVSNGTTTFYWYDENDTFLNIGYDTDLSGFHYWSATTSTPFLRYVYLKGFALNWDYSLTLPTTGYHFWIIQDGGSISDRIFRYKSGGNWHYSECSLIKTITLANKTLQLSSCPPVSENPITNVFISMGAGNAPSGIYLLVYTDENLDILITDESTMYAYLDNLANYNATYGNWTPEQGIILPAGTCDNLGTIAGALCQVITYLFVPTNTSLNQFSSLKDAIATKPPFGYWTSIKGYLNNLTATGTPAFSLTAELQNISIFATLKTGLTWLLWLIFGVWVIKRIARFDF